MFFAIRVFYQVRHEQDFKSNGSSQDSRRTHIHVICLISVCPAFTIKHETTKKQETDVGISHGKEYICLHRNTYKTYYGTPSRTYRRGCDFLSLLPQFFCNNPSTMTTLDSVKEAILDMGERTGSSVHALNKWFEAHSQVRWTCLLMVYSLFQSHVCVESVSRVENFSKTATNAK